MSKKIVSTGAVIIFIIVVFFMVWWMVRNFIEPQASELRVASSETRVAPQDPEGVERAVVEKLMFSFGSAFSACLGTSQYIRTAVQKSKKLAQKVTPIEINECGMLGENLRCLFDQVCATRLCPPKTD